MLYKLSGSENEFCLEPSILDLAFSNLGLDFMIFKPRTIHLKNYEEVKLISSSSFIFEASLFCVLPVASSSIY